MKQKILFFTVILLILSSCWNSFISKEIKDIPKENVWDKKILLTLWDSLTAGYWVSIQDNYPSKLSYKLENQGYDYEIINGWVSGDTSKNLLDRVELYIDKKPDIVVLVIWGNDGLRGLPTWDMEENILEIIDILEQTWAKIVVSGMDIPINLWIKYRSEFRNVYENIAKQKSDIYFQELFLENVSWDVRLNLNDRIHPNADGYDIIVNNLYEFLKKEDIITQ